MAGYRIGQKSFNTVNIMRALTMPKAVERQSLTRLREKLDKIEPNQVWQP